MVVMVFVSRTAVSRSTLSAAALSRAGSHVVSPVASAAAATPRSLHHAPWVVQVALDLQEVASVVASEVGLMVDAAAFAAAVEAAVVFRTEALAVAVAEEVVSDMEEEEDLAAETEAEEDLEIVDQTVGTEHHRQMPQLGQEVLGLVFRDHHPEASVLVDMVRLPRIAMEFLVEVQVGMVADHHTTTVDLPAAIEVAIVAMVIAEVIAIVEAIAQHRAEATWRQFDHASRARTADIETEIQEITTWV